MSNTDPSKGPVFRPPKDFTKEYREAAALGAKGSKERSQYDTGTCVTVFIGW